MRSGAQPLQSTLGAFRGHLNCHQQAKFPLGDPPARDQPRAAANALEQTTQLRQGGGPERHGRWGDRDQRAHAAILTAPRVGLRIEPLRLGAKK